MAAAASRAAVAQFIEREDLTLLEKPVTFDKHERFSGYLCCLGAIAGISSIGFSALCVPVGTCCPGSMVKHFALQLDQDSLQLHDAVNDCCCHVATTQKTVPLEKIQDVELVENCLLTCFQLKLVNVQTAGQGGGAPEVSAAFLQSPEDTRAAIRLAVKLYRAGPAAAPAPVAGMQRGGSGGGGGGGMRARLQRLDQLVAKGALTQTEVDASRAALLVAHPDPSESLWEAAELLEQGLVTAADYSHMKATLLAVPALPGQLLLA